MRRPKFNKHYTASRTIFIPEMYQNFSLSDSLGIFSFTPPCIWQNINGMPLFIILTAQRTIYTPELIHTYKYTAMTYYQYSDTLFEILISLRGTFLNSRCLNRTICQNWCSELKHKNQRICEKSSPTEGKKTGTRTEGIMR